MQGNIYEAMARAVEHTSVIVVFLTRKYIQSANCNIEFKYLQLFYIKITFICGPRYAVRRNKPLVVIFADENLDLPDFIKQGIENAPKFYGIYYF